MFHCKKIYSVIANQLINKLIHSYITSEQRSNYYLCVQLCLHTAIPRAVCVIVDDGRVFASGRIHTQLMLRQLMKVLRRLFVLVAVVSVAMVQCYCWWLVDLLLVSLDRCCCASSFSARMASIHLIADGDNFCHGGEVR